MPIALPEAQLEYLPGSPLKLAIVQVRFRPDPAVETPEKQVELSRALEELFELESRDTVQTLVLQIGQGQPIAPPPATRQEPMLRFAARDAQSNLAITPSSVGLETGSYRTFEEFIDQLEHALTAVSRVVEMRTITRLGVRYVNEIQDERLSQDGGIANIVSEAFLPAGGALGLDIRGGFSELLFSQPDGTFTLRRGLVEQTKYLLDMDYYTEEERPWELPWVLETVGAYHDVIESVFAAVLSPAFLDELRVAREERA